MQSQKVESLAIGLMRMEKVNQTYSPKWWAHESTESHGTFSVKDHP